MPQSQNSAIINPNQQHNSELRTEQHIKQENKQYQHLDRNYQQNTEHINQSQLIDQQYDNKEKEQRKIQQEKESSEKISEQSNHNHDNQLESKPDNLSKNILDNNQKIASCNCKKSKCLKMYCQCYAQGTGCKDSCRCINCQNTSNNLYRFKRQNRNGQEIQKSQDSNKKSLKPKERSCNCKKSSCLKKYCECFNASQACSDSCKCQDCKNNGDPNVNRNDRSTGMGSIQIPNFNLGMSKQMSEAPSEGNNFNELREEEVVKKREKLDEDEIETKISQILKLVPSENYQSMLDFLAYYLS